MQTSPEQLARPVDTPSAGPLAGLRVVEFEGIGPAPFACMMLSDLGADVITLTRPGAPPASSLQFARRGRTHVAADLKQDDDLQRVRGLLRHADVLVEGFRPGVMERLGLGPDTLLADHPRLIYARMTGWGQQGPLAKTAAHDINFIALTGALHAIGPAAKPTIPLNLVGDYGGGALYLVVGILAAWHEARSSGRGQVVDAAICDGVLSLLTPQASRLQMRKDHETRHSNLLDGGHAYYGVYDTADGEHIAIGAIEPAFFAELCQLLDIDPALRADDAQLRDVLTRTFARRTRDEWCTLLEGTDACFAPVLRLSEAARHPHLVARQAFVDIDGATQPAPAPRFSRTPARIKTSHTLPLTDWEHIAARWT